LTSGSNGWTFTLLSPLGPASTGSLTLDTKGNLYDEANGGMKNGECGNTGCGTVFALHPLPDGKWREIVLYDFGGGDDGYRPSGGLTFNGDGLCGTTEGGGSNYCFGGCGAIFELTHGTGKSVDEQIVHAFGENQADGVLPLGGVVFDTHGDMFGVTVDGGADEFGIVYGLKPQGSGKWGFALLHSFVGTDGVDPDARLTIDSKGNLYGTTSGGGSGEGGVVFELSPTQQASK